MAPSKPTDQTRKRERVTGLRLPADLVKDLKHLAVDTDKTLRETVITALREYVGARHKRPA